MLDLYKNIRRYRIFLDMSQADLAKKTGYTDRSSIAKIERGDVDLPQSKIMAFAKALHVSPGELMGNVEETGRRTSLTDSEHQLIDNFRKLNKKGQQQVQAYTKDLIDLDRYTEPSPEAYEDNFA